MDAHKKVQVFYAQIDWDLVIYTIVLLTLVMLTWIAFFLRKGREALSAGIAITLFAPALIFAAQQYRAGIPEKMAADAIAIEASPSHASQTFYDRYNATASAPRFYRLAVTWFTISFITFLAAFALRKREVNGVTVAVVLLCLSTFALDYAAHQRDLKYADFWQSRLRSTRS